MRRLGMIARVAVRAMFDERMALAIARAERESLQGSDGGIPGAWALEHDLRRALYGGQFELYYQPMIAVPSGRISGVEALIRWHHPVRGLLLPDSFIPLAEQTGLIDPIGEWVLRQACRQASAWRGCCKAPVRVAVNVSAAQLHRGNLVELLAANLAAERLPGGTIELELTESAVVANPEESGRTLRGLRELGVQISLDDFGSGYSSLSLLRRFPIGKLKIDRSFIHEVLTSRTDQSIVQGILSLARGLQLKTVAEGVESAEQLELLASVGVDEYQGHHFSAAAPAACVQQLLRANGPSGPR